MFDGAPSLLPHLNSGRLRPLAAASVKRNPLLPELPTFAELGYRELEVGFWYGLLAPARTPRAIVDKLNLEMNRVLLIPDVRARFADQGAEIAGGTPQQFADFMRAEMGRWGAVVKQAGIRTD
jgi:tripartite-type tricarboxylate transporter receptor subunit TctC